MEGTLIITECVSGHLMDSTAELLSAAAGLGEPVILGVVSPDPAAVGGLRLNGVDRVIGIAVPADPPAHEVRQRAVEALMEITSPRTVLLALSWDTAAFAAGMAERGGYAFATDVVALSNENDGSLLATRRAYGGKVDVTLRLAADCTAVLLLRPGIWPAASDAGEPAPVEIVDVIVSGETRVRRIDLIEPETRDADLGQAEVIFGLGRGVGKAEHIAVFEDVARELGVALGASRPLVDLGLVAREKQIGQSGVTVKPKLYVAFGISGSLQHMAGISESKMIFAINTDEKAPIFDSAHLGSHVDAIEVARHLLSQD